MSTAVGICVGLIVFWFVIYLDYKFEHRERILPPLPRRKKRIKK